MMDGLTGSVGPTGLTVPEATFAASAARSIRYDAAVVMDVEDVSSDDSAESHGIGATFDEELFDRTLRHLVNAGLVRVHPGEHPDYHNDEGSDRSMPGLLSLTVSQSTSTSAHSSVTDHFAEHADAEHASGSEFPDGEVDDSFSWRAPSLPPSTSTSADDADTDSDREEPHITNQGSNASAPVPAVPPLVGPLPFDVPLVSSSISIDVEDEDSDSCVYEEEVYL